MMTGTTPEPIAIVGLAAIMPDAPDAATFWNNLKAGRYSISDVPPERWDPQLYYDADPHVPDKTYSRIGGWVREFPWDPMRLAAARSRRRSPTRWTRGSSGPSSAARAALTDAGWPDWDVDPERVAVILGNAIGGEKHYATNLRIELARGVARACGASPTFAASARAGARLDHGRDAQGVPLAGCFEITEDTMPGELANVIAGRIANLFNFRGPNFTTDAACASGLAAMWSATQGLVSHAVRRGAHRRHRPQHGRGRIRQVLQDRCAVRDGHASVRRRRRRLRHGRGRGVVRHEAACRTPNAPATASTRCCWASPARVTAKARASLRRTRAVRSWRSSAPGGRPGSIRRPPP